MHGTDLLRGSNSRRKNMRHRLLRRNRLLRPNRLLRHGLKCSLGRNGLRRDRLRSNSL